MARLIGVVKTIVGEVYAVAADGSKRLLEQGDRVYAGEQLQTGADGAVAIRLVNGEELTVGRDSLLMLDNQLLAGDEARARIEPATPEEVPSSFQLTDVEQVQQAIAAGIDPTTGLPATAAGPAAGAGGAGSGGGGISFVMLGETADRVDPNIGYPTGPLPFAPLSPTEFPVDADELPDNGVIIGGLGVANGEVLVNEDDLPDGSDETPDPLSQSGVFTITAPDGIATISIGGQIFTFEQLANSGTTNLVIDSPAGVLVINGYSGTDTSGTVFYTYTLQDPVSNAPGSDQAGESFVVIVKDVDGSTGSASLDVTIIDDHPDAVDDGSSLSEDASSVGGNVLTNDVAGADGGKVVSTPGSYDGTYGQLVLNADGSYTYTLYTDPATQAIIQGLSEGESLSESFAYTMRDADNDTDSALLTLTIQGADDGVVITGLNQEGGEVLVDEDDLPDGTDQTPDPLSESGTFAITAPDGIATISIGGTTFTYAQLANSGTTNLVIDSPAGVLVINGYSGTEAGGTVSYAYTLQDPVSNALGSDQATESFAVVVADVDGSFANASLDVAIVDDQPIAENDSASLSEDAASVGGNVLTNDIAGADGGKVVTTPGSYAGTYGQLVLNADGSYTYTLYTDPATQAIIQGLSEGESLSESFGYGMQDSDQDPSSATLTLTIEGAEDGVTITGLNQQGGEVLVDEDDLPDGTDQSDPLSQSGTFAITAPDGIATISIGGTTFTYAQLANSGTTNLVLDSPAGVLVINGYSGSSVGGTVSYTYTLQDPVSNAPGSDQAGESFAVVVTDVDGSFANASLDVAIVDDQPIAEDDSASLSEDAASVGGNVLTNDIAGADGGKVVTTPGSYAGTYGQLVLNADGSYTYTLYTDAGTQATIQGLSAGESLSDSFAYTMRDADSDTDGATLTLTIQGADDGVTITGLGVNGGEVLVDEDDLPDGTDQTPDPLSQSGTFAIAAPDGIATISIGGTTFTYAQLANSGTTNLVIDSPAGVLVINGYSGTSAGGTVSYTYTLQDPVSNAPGSDQATESFAVVVVDQDGSSDTASLDVVIVDDLPTLTVTANVQGVAAALGVELDETTGPVDHYAAGETHDTYVNDDVPGALAQKTSTISGGLASLFTVSTDYGADGQGDPAGNTETFSFTGVPPTGLATTLTATDGGQVTLFANGDGSLTGKDEDGNTVLTIEVVMVDGVAQLRTTLYEALDNGDDNTFDEAVDLLLAEGSELKLQYEVIRTDGDDDSIVKTAEVVLADSESSVFSFDDDGPTPFFPDDIHVVLGVEDPKPTTITREINFLSSTGSDGVGSVSFTIENGSPLLDADGNQLYLNNEPLYLYYDGDSQHIVARTSQADGSDMAFTAEITADGEMSITMFSGTFISNTSVTEVTDLSGIGGGNVPFKGLNLGTTQNPDPDGSDDILVSSEIMPLGGDQGTVNSNANELGVGQGNELSIGDVIRYDLVTGLSIDTTSGSESYSFSGYQQTSVFRQQLTVSGGSKDADFKLRIYNTSGSVTDSSTSMVGTTALAQLVLTIGEIVIYDANGAVQDNTKHVALDADGKTLILYDLKDDWTFEIRSVDAFGDPEVFNAVEIEAIESVNGAVSTDGTTTSFKLADFSYGEQSDLQPVTFTLPVTGVDGDGDALTSGIDVTVYPDTQSIEGSAGDDSGAKALVGTDGQDYIFGYAGNDHLLGNGGDDILLGGMGNDLMEGGAGRDTFLWQANETGTDTIVGFEKGQDILELADLLNGDDGEAGDIGNLLQYIDISTNGVDTVIKVSASGAFSPTDVTGVAPDAGLVDQTIVLQNVNLLSAAPGGYGSTEADVITGMLGDGTLKVDTV